MTQDKTKDYDYIIRNIDTMYQVQHLEIIQNMINCFDVKWQYNLQKTYLHETVELRAILKYKQNQLNLFDRNNN
jgi:hypothetical protein